MTGPSFLHVPDAPRASCAADHACGCGSGLDGATEAGCSLDPVDLPARAERFRALFARALRARERVDGGVVWTLAASPEVAAEAEALTAAEADCCSFLVFDLERRGDALRWTARAPTGGEPVLALLDGIAAEALR